MDPPNIAQHTSLYNTTELQQVSTVKGCSGILRQIIIIIINTDEIIRISLIHSVNTLAKITTYMNKIKLWYN